MRLLRASLDLKSKPLNKIRLAKSTMNILKKVIKKMKRMKKLKVHLLIESIYSIPE